MHTQRFNLSALGTRAGIGALVVTGFLATAACGTENGGKESGSASVGTRQATEITGKQWNVRSMTVDGKEHDAPAGAYVEFEKDGTVGGNYGCNHFGASAEIKGDTITVGDDAVKTKKACTAEGAMDFETQLGKALSDSTIKAEVDDDELTLTTDGYTVNLTAEQPADLYGTKWNVTGTVKDEAKGASAVALPAAAEGKAHLTFDEEKGTVSGELGCNRVTAKATVGDGTITLGTPGTTRKMCSDSLMDTEKTLLKLFGGTVKYQLKGSTLTLTSENGTGLEAVAAK
ncbi:MULTISPECIES: META domain-containing protein [Streptomyces]|uniref:META domain-containing protein n=1 Tax=Streptomyces apricus TaxID=1828112 RepID=A0A5B0AZ16_9ACTN|nr:META domain-containing protein [Streptomyces apricus]KAA0933775.1 META domain-containing protein [Streptomyces apricus]